MRRRFSFVLLVSVLATSLFASSASAQQSLVAVGGDAGGMTHILPDSSQVGMGAFLDNTPGFEGDSQIYCYGVYDAPNDPTSTWVISQVSAGDRDAVAADATYGYRIFVKCLGRMPADSTAVLGMSLGFESNDSPQWRIGAPICNDQSPDNWNCTGTCRAYDGEYYVETSGTERLFAWSTANKCGHPDDDYACDTGDGNGHANGVYSSHALPQIVDGRCFGEADLTTAPAVADTYGFTSGGVTRSGFVAGLFGSGLPGMIFSGGSYNGRVGAPIHWIDWYDSLGSQDLSSVPWPVVDATLPEAWGIENDPNAIDLGPTACGFETVSVDGGTAYTPGLIPEAAPETFLSSGSHTFRWTGSVNGDALLTLTRWDGFGVEYLDQSTPIPVSGDFDVTGTMSVPDDGLFIIGALIQIEYGSDCGGFATGIGDRLGTDYSFDPISGIGPAVSACYDAVDPAWLEFGWVLDALDGVACTVETLVVPTVPLDYWVLELQASAKHRVPLSWASEVGAAGVALGGLSSGSCAPIELEVEGQTYGVAIAGCQGSLPDSISTMANITRTIFAVAIYGAVASMIWRTAPWNKEYRDGAVF